uniref:Uncharacterized protein n=1 Tax=Aegilops tauschii subsp. strangulata TaxID=200361 RepID=A0A453FJX4_AEGTS
IPILERFSLFICIALVWAYAQILTSGGAYNHSTEVTQINCRTDRANLISSAPWIKIPYPLQWGAPTFSAGQSFGMVSAVLVSLIESTASYSAAARLASATPPPAHILSRGIGWQGIGILLCGLFGTGTGSTVSVENVGLLGSTRIGSRRVIQICAGFMIFFSMLGEIWSAVRLHPVHHLCRGVLRPVRTSCRGGALLLAVHQHELHAQPVHRRRVHLPWLVRAGVLLPLQHGCPAWSCAH